MPTQTQIDNAVAKAVLLNTAKVAATLAQANLDKAVAIYTAGLNLVQALAADEASTEQWQVLVVGLAESRSAQIAANGALNTANQTLADAQGAFDQAIDEMLEI